MITECEFSNIYNEYYPKIIQYLSRIAGPNDAEDLAQDVLNLTAPLSFLVLCHTYSSGI